MPRAGCAPLANVPLPPVDCEPPLAALPARDNPDSRAELVVAGVTLPPAARTQSRISESVPAPPNVWVPPKFNGRPCPVEVEDACEPPLAALPPRDKLSAYRLSFSAPGPKISVISLPVPVPSVWPLADGDAALPPRDKLSAFLLAFSAPGPKGSAISLPVPLPSVWLPPKFGRGV